ncbi:MAG: TetR/AcrR family transcriptional regulator [Janthinobacterium lividum]
MTASTPRREAIAATAARLFAERGFHAVSINDIGRAMGTSGPALYRHFPSKDALLGQMLTDISDALLAGAQARSGGLDPTEPIEPTADGASADNGGAGRTPREALRSLVRWHVDFALARPDLIVVQNRELSSLATVDSARVRGAQRSYVELWVSATRAALGGDLEVRRVRSAVQAVFGMLNSTPHSTHVPTMQMADLLEAMAMASLDALADKARPPAVSAADSAGGPAGP